MKSYDAARTLYLYTEASGISLGDRSLQVRNGINCEHSKIPDNEMFLPALFVIKSLSSVILHYSNIEFEVLRITSWAREVSPLLLHEKSTCHH